MKFCAKKCKREQFSKEAPIVKYLPENLFLDKYLFYEKVEWRKLKNENFCWSYTNESICHNLEIKNIVVMTCGRFTLNWWSHANSPRSPLTRVYLLQILLWNHRSLTIFDYATNQLTKIAFVSISKWTCHILLCNDFPMKKQLKTWCGR